MSKLILLVLISCTSLLSQTDSGELSTTLQDTLIADHFVDMSNWTSVGPQGINNWYTQSTNFSGGNAPPELVFSWTPLFLGNSYLLSPVIHNVNNHNLELTFIHSIDWWSDTMKVGVAITYDGGNSYTSIWEFAAVTHNPPTVESITISGSDSLQIALYYTGDSNDADFWYIDDLYLIDLGIVPVEFTSFNAINNQNNVELSWITASETNNYGFEVQRMQILSPQFSISNDDWNTLGFVNGNGTKTEPQSYSFIDRDLQAGKYQYRLKQIDLDGTFEYSNVIEVEINLPTKFSLEQNYPNPFNPNTIIRFEIPGQARNDNVLVTLKVYDVLGNEVATLVNEEKPAGIYEVSFDSHSGLFGINELPSGVYYYELKAGSFVQTKKMMLLK